MQNENWNGRHFSISLHSHVPPFKIEWEEKNRLLRNEMYTHFPFTPSHQYISTNAFEMFASACVRRLFYSSRPFRLLHKKKREKESAFRISNIRARLHPSYNVYEEEEKWRRWRHTQKKTLLARTAFAQNNNNMTAQTVCTHVFCFILLLLVARLACYLLLLFIWVWSVCVCGSSSHTMCFWTEWEIYKYFVRCSAKNYTEQLVNFGVSMCVFV